MKRIVLLLAILSLPLWATWQNPTPVYVGPGDQTVDVVISDGEGGAAVIWRDDLTEWNYMQVIDSAGNLKWDADGVPIIANASLSTQNPDVFLDADGNYWVALEGNEDIYVQKLSPAGQRLFGDDGVAVCTAEGEQRNPVICYSINAAIVVWKDARVTIPIYPYSQRVSQDGSILWEVDGVRITETDYGTLAKCVHDGYGGAFYIFRRWIESENYISGQRLDSLGTRMWGDSGTLYVKGRMHPQKGSICGYMVPNTEGGFVFFYDGGAYYKANQVDSVGTLMWDTAGIIVGEDDYRSFGSVSPLSASGLYVVRGETEASELVYAHRLTLSGETPWGDSGKVLVWEAMSGNPRDDIIPSVTDNGIVAWRDVWDEMGWYEQQGILAQRFDTSGNILWSNEVIVAGTEGSNPYATSTYDKGAIIMWQTGDIYAARIDSLGNISGINEQPIQTPMSFQLEVVDGNILKGSSHLRFSIEKGGFVHAVVYEVTGRRIRTLENGYVNAGSHELFWDGYDEEGHKLSSGVYFIRVDALEKAATAKVVLVK